MEKVIVVNLLFRKDRVLLKSCLEGVHLNLLATNAVRKLPAKRKRWSVKQTDLPVKLEML